MYVSRGIRVPLRSLAALAASFPFSSQSAGAPGRLIEVSDTLRKARRFPAADVADYASLSRDHNPIHSDPEFARRFAGFDRGSVVHGMLVADLFPFVIASYFPGAVYASQYLQFKLPVYIEDEVVAEIQAVNLMEHNKVKFTTKCFQDQSLVIDGEATTILSIPGKGNASATVNFQTIKYPPRPLATATDSVLITPSFVEAHGPLKVGSVLREARQFSAADVTKYTALGGYRNPIYPDPEFDKGSLVHNMLVASLFPYVIGSYFPGAVYVSQNLEFNSPVYVEDEVVAEMVAIKLKKHKGRFIAKFTTKCFIDQCLVVDGEATAILPTLTPRKQHATAFP